MASYPASSSPPSSPNTTWDSSPPASRDSSPISILDDSRELEWEHPRMVHPLAASAKASKPLRQYYKKHALPDQYIEESLSETPHKRPRLDNASRQSRMSLGSEASTIEGSPHARNIQFVSMDTEHSIWDEALHEAFQSEISRTHLDLAHKGLSYIPDDIECLSKFWTISNPLIERTEFARTSSTRLFERQISFRLPNDGISLILADNNISTLPKAVFGLENLTVLDLRQNKLRFIPPQIADLKRLQSLNISINRLNFLPSEMLGMNLNVACTSNPWKQLPRSFAQSKSLTLDRSLSDVKFPSRRGVSATETTSDQTPSYVPHLTELCMRKILQENLLEPDSTYLRQGILPESMKKLFESLVPGLKPPFTEPLQMRFASFLEEEEPMYEMGICPSPQHDDGSPVEFVKHQEVRFTWETRLLQGGPRLGDLVPFRWRGCSKGCLEFLDPHLEVKSGMQIDVPLTSQDEEDEEQVGEILNFNTSRDGFEAFDE